jgi:hypothetical protein
MNLQTFPCLPVDVFVKALTKFIQKHLLAPICTQRETTLFHSSLYVELGTCVERLVTYAPCSSEAFFLTLIYLSRVEKNFGFGFVNDMTISRLFVIGTILASKFFDDCAPSNAVYGRIVGMDKTEILELEIEFLYLLQFDFYVREEEFVRLISLFYSPKGQILPKMQNFYSLSKRVHQILFSPKTISHTYEKRVPQQQQQPPPNNIIDPQSYRSLHNQLNLHSNILSYVSPTLVLKVNNFALMNQEGSRVFI